jgi:hypothetical protein
MSALEKFDIAIQIFPSLNIRELVGVSHLNRKIRHNSQRFVQRRLRLLLTSLAPDIGTKPIHSI